MTNEDGGCGMVMADQTIRSSHGSMMARSQRHGHGQPDDTGCHDMVKVMVCGQTQDTISLSMNHYCTLAQHASATKPFACCHLKGGHTSPSIFVPATRCTYQSKGEMHAFLSRSGSSRLDQPFKRYEANNPKLANMRTVLLLTVFSLGNIQR